ncbi:metal-sensitive transcriptional regulator [Novibacillus thermophilus]|uniref:Transcriptional regulator n=1 Tax=Novibacillus thermophilus TaxID=1471761 RepID=A0A1U9K6U3_9BACL|nr:metal-sensitive transcriptional regulator [Novibacillus thermophilus]AQS55748.1 transcriptional regulator [Novibacillus thermophilus]
MSHEHDLPMQPDKKPVVPRSENEKEKIKNRLKKIEGQIRGLEKMVDEDRYCVDILIQIAAVQAALKKVGFSLLERHTKMCVLHSMESGNEDEMIEELMKVIQHYAK